MMTSRDLIADSTKRHEFVLLFDVVNGNPNGDPDAANAPRVDPETGRGFVTDVALKRKIRDYAALCSGAQIFIQSRVALNDLKSEAAERITPPLAKEERTSKKPIARLREKLCQEYFDIRMFGAVLATGDKEDRLNAGQVRGPVQLAFANSIDRIFPLDISITRQARTTAERLETGTTEMGRKAFVPYGLYRAHGFFNPFLAETTGVSSDDLNVLWAALTNLFEFDRSAARADMAVCGLYVFTHDSKLGNSPARKLFDLIQVSRNPGIVDEVPPRQFSDYVVTIAEERLPTGVTLSRLVD